MRIDLGKLQSLLSILLFSTNSIQHPAVEKIEYIISHTNRNAITRNVANASK